MDDREVLIYQNFFNFPDDCKVDCVISKSEIIKEGDLKTSDKNLFTKYVRQIKWCYNFSNDTIRLTEYVDDSKSYEEVQVINVILKDENFDELDNPNYQLKNYFKQDNKIDRIVEIIFKVIKYPQVIVVQYKDNIRLFMTNISNNLIDSTKYTLDEIISTNWINLNNNNRFVKELFNNLNLDNLNFKNAYTFYNSMFDSLIKYNGSLLVNHEVNLPPDQIQVITDKIVELNKKIININNGIKKETQFNKKLEMNIEINKLKNEIKEYEEKLLIN
ncbi:hypothetical protein BGI41_00520 [Methanobrevibacter sp. 87.7]|uniref:DUF4391 domain-containing protein n=1 Tax=Methanobrevibacter sp. 87.7 TaxID=387957 RepID=UPI000B4FEA6F|nr:DUF4391 domain-containing protein [Methanobrevibacter sp. 87.7]OWT33794.1 hypothetical protein BGI41_00520 [Methanobrevibacter sp. 87.7]